MIKKGELQISFAWLFAILVGIVILVLAIYLVVKSASTSESFQTVKAGKEMVVLFNSLESGVEAGRVSSFAIPSESRIANRCEEFGKFGEQIISLEQKSFGKFTKTNNEIYSKNIYVFSNEIVQGRNFYVFSKPFQMPFEVATVNYLTSSEDRYCFKGEEEVIEDIYNLNQTNLVIDSCEKGDIIVCFSNYNANCDINVHYTEGYLKKGEEVFYFDGDALMYAAIFSEKEIYECQVKRLMKRLEILISLYSDKKAFLGEKCKSEVDSSLISLKNLVSNYQNTRDILLISEEARYLENQNTRICRLW